MWRSVSSGCGCVIRVGRQSFVIAAGYFLVLFAYFKTDTPFILGSFSLSARHSSESSPAHHLFYNEAHHSCILWAPIEFTEYSHSEGLDQKLHDFILQLEPPLSSTGYNVHVSERPNKQAVMACINYNLPSPIFIVTVYWGLHQKPNLPVCFSSPFHAVCLRYHAFQTVAGLKQGREGTTLESGFNSLNRDENGPVAPWLGIRSVE